MKSAIVLLLAGVVAYAHAAAILAHAPLTSGASTVSRSEDGLGNYAFAYDESHATGGSFRRESGAPGAVTGSYGLRDADGRVRTVNYIADAAGFRASISSNEPGVEPKPAADTLINGAAYVAPAVAAAPVLAAPAAPVAVAAPAFAHAPVARLHAAPIAAAAPVLAAAPAAVSGIAYSSTVNHAIPAAPLVAAPAFAHAAPAVARLHAAPAVAAPVAAAAPWGYAASW